MHVTPGSRTRAPALQEGGADSRHALRCRRKFLRFFPGGFDDPTYLDWERGYKWQTHERWQQALGKREFRSLLRRNDHREIAARAVRVEQQSRHSMIFSFEKMALRDATKSSFGCKAFAEGLYDFLHGARSLESRFIHWVEVVGALAAAADESADLAARDGVRVHRAARNAHLPQAARHACRGPRIRLRFSVFVPTQLEYLRRSSGIAVNACRRDQRRLKPRDMIDIQSFIWVQGSDEYS